MGGQILFNLKKVSFHLFPTSTLFLEMFMLFFYCEYFNIITKLHDRKFPITGSLTDAEDYQNTDYFGSVNKHDLLALV